MCVTTENNYSLHCIFAVRGANPSLGLVNTIWFTSSAAGVAPVDMMKEFYFYDVSEILQLWQTHLELYGQFNHCFAPQLSDLNQWTGSFTLNAIDLIWLTCNLPLLLHDLVWMVLKFIQTSTASWFDAWVQTKILPSKSSKRSIFTRIPCKILGQMLINL